MFFPVFLITVIAITAIKAEVDCSNRPPRIKFSDCCELSNLVSEEVKEKCEEQKFGPPDGDHHGPPHHPHGPPDHPHGPPGGKGGPPPHMHCFISCAVNETGILIDGELQEDNVMSYLDGLFGDSEKVEFVNNELMICYEKQKDFESKWPERVHHHKARCNSNENYWFMGCVGKRVFMECPDKFWSNTDECNELRDHFEQCRPFKDKEDKDNNEKEEEEAEDI